MCGICVWFLVRTCTPLKVSSRKYLHVQLVGILETDVLSRSLISSVVIFSLCCLFVSFFSRVIHIEMSPPQVPPDTPDTPLPTYCQQGTGSCRNSQVSNT